MSELTRLGIIIKGYVPQLFLSIADDLTSSGGGKRAPSLREDLQHMLREVASQLGIIIERSEERLFHNIADDLTSVSWKVVNRHSTFIRRSVRLQPVKIQRHGDVHTGKSTVRCECVPEAQIEFPPRSQAWNGNIDKLKTLRTSTAVPGTAARGRQKILLHCALRNATSCTHERNGKIDDLLHNLSENIS